MKKKSVAKRVTRVTLDTLVLIKRNLFRSVCSIAASAIGNYPNGFWEGFVHSSIASVDVSTGNL